MVSCSIHLFHLFVKSFQYLLLCLLSQQALGLEVLDNLHHRLLYALLIGVKMDFSVLRCLIRCGDTSEVWDQTLAGLLVKILWVAILSDTQRNINVDLNERDWFITLGDLSVCLTSGLAIGLIGRDERGECCGRCISKELGDLFSH